jgi:catechol-2,3-dioxygenase
VHRLRRRAGEEIDGDLEGELASAQDFDRAPRQDNLFRAMKLEGIDHVAIAVRDLAQTAEWYREVLGSTAIALFPEKKSSAHTKRGGPMLHLAFRTDRAGFVRAQAELTKHGISFRFEDHGIAHSIYFHDLNDLKLEITTYEVG